MLCHIIIGLLLGNDTQDSHVCHDRYLWWIRKKLFNECLITSCFVCMRFYQSTFHIWWMHANKHNEIHFANIHSAEVTILSLCWYAQNFHNKIGCLIAIIKNLMALIVAEKPWFLSHVGFCVLQQQQNAWAVLVSIHCISKMSLIHKISAGKGDTSWCRLGSAKFSRLDNIGYAPNLT